VAAIGLSVLVGTVLMLLKFHVYRITDSAAVLSDALESIINVVASSFALGSVLLAAKPPDRSHPYGHGKIEYFSAGFEGALIVLAAVGIFKIGVSHMLEPRPLPRLESGLLMLLGISMVNLLLGMGLVRAGKKTDSPAILADGKHVLTDVYTSGAMVLGLFMVHLTGWFRLDGAIACLVGVNILVSGAKLVRQSFSALMDASDEAILGKIAALLIERRREPWIDIHELRAWRAGSFVHIDLHLILPRDLSLEQAHREGKELENLLVDAFRGMASVLIHLDPCIDPDCPVCARHVCKARSDAFEDRVAWSLETMTMDGQDAERLKDGRSFP